MEEYKESGALELLLRQWKILYGHSVIDISGRGHFKFNYEGARGKADEGLEGYNFSYLEHFMESFAKQLGANLIITVNNPSASADLHTIMETVFKSLGMALDQATQVDPRRKGAVPSDERIID